MSRSTVRLVMALVVGTCALYGVLNINRSWLTPGASSDSVDYLEAARSLTRQGTLEVPVAAWSSPDSVSPLAHFPPGFPLAISAVMRLHVRAHPAALWIMALSADVAVAFAFLILADSFGAGAGLLGVLVLLVTPAFVRLHMAIWSEPTYLALTIPMLYVMLVRPRWAGVYGILAAAAFSVRYVGIAGSATAVLWATLQGRGWKDRLIGAVVAGAPSAAFFGWWWSWVGAAGGTVRAIGVYGGLERNLHEAAGLITDWLVPRPWQGEVWTGALVLLLGALILVQTGQAGGWRAPVRRRFALLTAIYCVAYVAVVVVARLFADPRIPFDTRLLLPVLVLSTLCVAASVVASDGSQRRWIHAAVMGILAVWIASAWHEVRQGVATVNQIGRFYTYAGWVESPVIRWVDNNAVGYDVIYSNEPELIYYDGGRHAKRLPDAGEDLSAFAEAFHQHRSAVIIAYPLHLGNLPDRVFVEALKLKTMVRTDLGSVYVPARAP